MKFVHIADMHFDAPFVTLSDKTEFCKLRRLEQREIFKKIINYIKENEIPYLFISGDLYEHKYIRQSTIEYINSLFKTIPDTKIFISPGNHDPYVKDSFYNKFIWSENVIIFTSKINKISLDDVNIYGYGFDDFYSTRVNIDEINIDEKDKLNILIIHGTLDGSDVRENCYNPISKKILEDIGFDYVALGHIHKRNYDEYELNKKIIYPGSTISLGFDEQGEHGMIVGNLEKDNLELNFIKLDDKIFVEKDIDVSDINSEDDLVQKLNEIEIDNNYYKINLIGKRKFEININEIKKLNINENILRIKNKTQIDINIEEIAKGTTLTGMFAKEIQERINEDPLNTEFFNEVLEIGLEILDK